MSVSPLISSSQDKLIRHLSRALRHKPEAYGISLDKEGMGKSRETVPSAPTLRLPMALSEVCRHRVLSRIR